MPRLPWLERDNNVVDVARTVTGPASYRSSNINRKVTDETGAGATYARAEEPKVVAICQIQQM